MALQLSVFIICALGILVSTLFNLRLRIGKVGFGLYWLIPLVCAAILLASGGVDAKAVWQSFTSNDEVNPLKILVLFLSMSALSVYLDEIGFFKWLANAVLKKAGASQKKLFFFLYITTSILTVFTSNDVIILTFTPFICYFARNCDIDPVPFIFTEFVAANTWSMFLIIGICVLCAATVLLAISSYIGIEMWIVSLSACGILLVASTIATLAQKKSMKPIGKTLARLPWQLVPFLLSMFVIVLSLNQCGVTEYLASSLQKADCALTFGTTSALFANLMNNIPMSVLYSQILQSVAAQNLKGAIYASIIGSNLGALLTPIGALAAIMWSSILKTQNVKFSFLDFVKRGMLVGIPSLLCAIGGLEIILLI